ncbi:MAG: peptidoglycan D,D-transpeptidase FtsI family protein [Thermoleophilia bacterium]|jgi:cell division protein FtsI (penicillin-binding protein 3)
MRRQSSNRRLAGNRRLAIFMGVAVVFLAALFVRTFYVQVVAAPSLKEQAQEQSIRTVALDAPRGIIYDRDGCQLAVSAGRETVYANPREVADPDAAAERLGDVLGLSVDDLAAKLRRDTQFVYLARKVSSTKGDAVKALGLSGITVCAEDKRVYPNGALAPQLLGFVGTDGTGLAGLEKEYDELLTGEAGQAQVVSDPDGNRLRTTSLKEAVPGRSITLTIDEGIQFETEKVLTGVVEEFKALKACAVVIDPRNGEILAMANTPVFDTNAFGSVEEKDRRNSVVTDQYEPGSTFKMIVAAAALEGGLVTPDTTFTLGRQVQVYDRVVHEAHEDNLPSMRELSVTQIIAQSSNVGAVVLGKEVGKDRLADMIYKFGFTQKLGIDFPGETPGMMLEPDDWSGTTIANVPIGQGISVTPLQMAASYAAVANDGLLVQPHLVRDVSSPWSRRVVSEKVAAQLRAMLLAVTEEDGTGTNACIAGYEVAGKTGTAQKVDEKTGKYAVDRFVASFVGMVPADDPRVVVLVMVDEPKTQHLGALVAAPAFAEIAGLSLKILGVAPNGAD